MAKVRVIEVHENVFNTNNQEADALRKRLVEPFRKPVTIFRAYVCHRQVGGDDGREHLVVAIRQQLLDGLVSVPVLAEVRFFRSQLVDGEDVGVGASLKLGLVTYEHLVEFSSRDQPDSCLGAEHAAFAIARIGNLTAVDEASHPLHAGGLSVACDAVEDKPAVLLSSC